MFNFKSEAEKLVEIGKTVGVKVAEVGVPAAAETLLPGPGGNLAGSILSSIFAHVASGGQKPNTTLLSASIIQVVEGVFGILEATGKVQANSQIAQAVDKVITQAQAVSQPGVVTVGVPKIPSAN
jgi:hypothetical protein